MELDEHEQGELVQKWLRQNGSSLITGIAMGLALVFGWQWWQGKDTRHQQEAAAQFQSLTQAIDAKDESKVSAFSTSLADKYPDTAYAHLAVLRRAAYLQSAGKSDQAIQLLTSTMAEVKQPEMLQMFKFRLSRLLFIAGKTAEARKQVESISNSRFPSVTNELIGDIAAAEGRREDARKAYQIALTTLDQAAPTRNLVELKLIDAGGQPPAKPET